MSAAAPLIAPDRVQRRLHAYHDGELSGFSRWRFESQLKRSPELRRELALLDAIGRSARAEVEPLRSPELWGALSASLPAIDSQVEAEASTRDRPSAPRVAPWRMRWPLGAAALATALAVALVVQQQGALEAPAPAYAVGGTVRFLDTGGRPVMVMDESEQLTIIWLMPGERGEI